MTGSGREEDGAARIARLEAAIAEANLRISGLEAALGALDYLLHPHVLRHLTNLTGGSVCDVSRDVWRLRGFYDVETGADGVPFRWSNPAAENGLLFFLVPDETYRGRIRAMAPGQPGGFELTARIDGSEVALRWSDAEQCFVFSHPATRLGWHELTLVSPFRHRPAPGSADARNLGFVLRSAEMLPVGRTAP